MKHKDKLKLARKMSPKKTKATKGFGPFDSPAWQTRKKRIADRVAKKQANAHARSLAKKQEKKFPMAKLEP